MTSWDSSTSRVSRNMLQRHSTADSSAASDDRAEITTSTSGVLTMSLTGISRSHEFKQAISAGLGGILARISRQ